MLANAGCGQRKGQARDASKHQRERARSSAATAPGRPQRPRHTAVVRLLLEAAPAAATSADRDGWLPLHTAAQCKRSAMVRPLLRAAPQTACAADRWGRTPLQVAIERSKLMAARALLGAGPAAAALAALAAAGPPALPPLCRLPAGPRAPTAGRCGLGAGALTLPRHRARAACGAGLHARPGSAGGAAPAARRPRAPAHCGAAPGSP